MGAATRTPEMVAAWSAKSPLGRLAEPADVANMALFLASDEASLLHRPGDERHRRDGDALSERLRDARRQLTRRGYR